MTRDDPAVDDIVMCYAYSDLDKVNITDVTYLSLLSRLGSRST